MIFPNVPINSSLGASIVIAINAKDSPRSTIRCTIHDANRTRKQKVSHTILRHMLLGMTCVKKMSFRNRSISKVFRLFPVSGFLVTLVTAE